MLTDTGTGDQMKKLAKDLTTLEAEVDLMAAHLRQKHREIDKIKRNMDAIGMQQIVAPPDGQNCRQSQGTRVVHGKEQAAMQT